MHPHRLVILQSPSLPPSLVLPLTTVSRFEKEFDGVQDVFELQVFTTAPRPKIPLPFRPPPILDSNPFPPPFFPSLQRNLNNAFAYDLVPSPTVVAAALRAARRVNDFATAVRIFEGTSRPLVSPDNQGLDTDIGL